MKQAELQRREQRRQEREKRRLKEFCDSFPTTDSRFFCEIGYTSGGAPYDVTSESIGPSPRESPEETL